MQVSRIAVILNIFV